MIVICEMPDEHERWTEPLLEELRQVEPTEFIRIITGTPETSYADSINSGLDGWPMADEWALVLNADVVCTGSWTHNLGTLPKTLLYGNTINSKEGLDWIDGWLYLINRQVWEKVGPFDGNFKIASFEDLDYTLRAREAGIQIAQINLPFKHYSAGGRMRKPDFWLARQGNLKYLRWKHAELPVDWGYR